MARHPSRCREALLLVVALAHPGLSLLAAAHARVAQFECKISLRSGRQAGVQITAGIEGAESLPNGIWEQSVISYRDQHMTDFRFSAGDEVLQFAVRRDNRVTRYAFQIPAKKVVAGAVFRYQAQYSVVSQSEAGLQRIPVLVPALPTPAGARVVRILVEIAADNRVPTGDTFPHFSWEKSGMGSAVLGNIPSFVKVTRKPAGAISAADRLKEPAFLNDAAILATMLLASLFWGVWYRRK